MTATYKNFEAGVRSIFGEIDSLSVRRGFGVITEDHGIVKVSKGETSNLRDQEFDGQNYVFVAKGSVFPKLIDRCMKRETLEVFTGGTFVQKTVVEKKVRQKIPGSSFARLVEVTVEETENFDSGVNYEGTFLMADYEELENGDVKFFYEKV